MLNAPVEKMILLIDNYDSFVYNLSRYFIEMGCQTMVVRNDQISVAEVEDLHPEAVVLSPGPCTPREAGICVELVRELGERVPMLGVCLGHQAMATALGAEVVQAPEPVHGRTSLISHGGQRLFADLPSPLRATRYHSLMVREDSLPEETRVTARTHDRLVMAFEHRSWTLIGVQFHPESVLTSAGHRLLFNFLKLAGICVEDCPAGDFVGSGDEAEQGGDPGSAKTTLHW